MKTNHVKIEQGKEIKIRVHSDISAESLSAFKISLRRKASSIEGSLSEVTEKYRNDPYYKHCQGSLTLDVLNQAIQLNFTNNGKSLSDSFSIESEFDVILTTVDGEKYLHRQFNIVSKEGKNEIKVVLKPAFDIPYPNYGIPTDDVENESSPSYNENCKVMTLYYTKDFDIAVISLSIVAENKDFDLGYI